MKTIAYGGHWQRDSNVHSAMQRAMQNVMQGAMRAMQNPMQGPIRAAMQSASHREVGERHLQAAAVAEVRRRGRP